MPLDNLLREAQAEPCSAFSLGGEERGKEAFHQLRGDARAIVSYLNLDLTVPNINGDRNAAAPLKRLQAVLQQICDYLPRFGRIAVHDCSAIGTKTNRNGRTPLPSSRRPDWAKHLDHVAAHLGNVHPLEIRLPPRARDTLPPSNYTRSI